MAGLKWIRIDTSIFENPKFLYLKEDRCYKTIVIHLEAMAYSGRHGYDGFIPKGALSRIGATTKEADRLIVSGLWTPAPGGYSIKDWDEYQPSTEEVRQRTKRAQELADRRWHTGKNGKEIDDA